jgi:hypothetical protein
MFKYVDLCVELKKGRFAKVRCVCDARHFICWPPPRAGCGAPAYCRARALARGLTSIACMLCRTDSSTTGTSASKSMCSRSRRSSSTSSRPPPTARSRPPPRRMCAPTPFRTGCISD